VIRDVDEVLRQLLIREIEIKGNEVDIVFDQPKREWSSRLSKPTIDLFLFDLRENLKLRTAEIYKSIPQPDGTSEIKRNPVRLDLRYLMTAWVKEPEDEHLLLSSALMALLRYPFLPSELLPEVFNNQPGPIPLTVATFTDEKGPVDKFSEIWGVLDNELRPGVLVTLTVAMDPYIPIIARQVLTRELRFMVDTGIGVPDAPPSTRSESHTYWVVGGEVKSEKHDPSTISVVLVEKGLSMELDEEARFKLSDIEEGEYNLDIMVNGKVIKRQTIEVPSPNYDVEV
jgi:hypothetical protein